MDIEKKSKQLREKAKGRISKETSKQTYERIKKALSKREEALDKIYQYQDEHGVPTENEIEKHFLTEEANVDTDEFNENK